MLQVSNLTIRDTRNGQVIVKNISFSIEAHTCLAIVGESGSGKSMTVKAISGLHNPWIHCNGKVLFEGVNLLGQTTKAMQEIRGNQIFMIFQDGMSAFDPSCTIGETFSEILLENNQCTKKDVESSMIAALEKVLLRNPLELLEKYPHQLSGGMLQRTMIAISLALGAKLIIADEPTTALDTITQYEVVKEFIRLRQEYATTMIFISHDLGIVRKIADYVILMKDGELVEEGPVEEIFQHPKSSYAKYLIGTRRELGENYNQLMGGNLQNA